MKKDLFFTIISMLFVFWFAKIGYAQDYTNWQIKSLAHLKQHFKNPPVEFRSAPLWVWNNLLTEDEIDLQLAELKAGGMGGVFIHPRPGLVTPYLSDDWFAMCRYTVEKASKLGMQVWLYDENSYPSGFAGGHVPAEMPESYNQGQGMAMRQMDKLPDKINDQIFLILEKEETGFADITKTYQQLIGKKGDYYLLEKSFYEKGGWFGGFSYVDLLLEEVTEKFIEVTMKGYEQAIGEKFGKIVPGIFTDEPNIHPPKGLKWTPKLFENFEKRWGYDLKTHVPSLFLEIGDWKRIRHNYYGLLLEMFVDRWGKPWHKYCEEKKLIWTGHYWEHGWPNPLQCIDNMALYAWHQMPAIDILMNQYSENVNGQFGNNRAVKELASVANQMGRSRTLSETYGAGGWDLRFEDMKRIGDWEYVLGVNFLNQHLSYITINGARKRDHPQSFSYHEPWWKFYQGSGNYFARLSLALSSGEQINRILVIEPTTTAWMYFSPAASPNRFSEIGTSFQQFVNDLEKYQIEYDLGSENIISNNGKVEADKFVIGKRWYDLVVFPPGLENLDKANYDLIESYLENGGKILSFASVPLFVDGTATEQFILLEKKHRDQWILAKTITDPQALAVLKSKQIVFNEPEKISGILFHHRRSYQDGELVFLVNTSLDQWSTGSFTIGGKSVTECQLTTGENYAYPFKAENNSLLIDFELPPAGSLLLSIDQTKPQAIPEMKKASIKVLTSKKGLKINREALNVLTIDYCDLKVNGKVENDLYFFKAADRIFKEFGEPGNPWSRAVQYKSSILDRDKFPENLGFEADYSFWIDKDVDRNSLRAVVERPELWQLKINDKLIQPIPSESWLDRSFGVYDISGHIVAGKNVVSLVASSMTIHSELESIYLLGNFNLAAQPKGWKLVKTAPLSLGAWNKQGLPFYADGVSYAKIFKMAGKGKRYIVKMPDWYGSVAEVLVNDQSAGIIAYQPNELDITDAVKAGDNEVRVVVYGTLKNLLGPHHSGTARGTAWPGMFEKAPAIQPAGEEYDFIAYGLFEDFLLLEVEGPAQRVYWQEFQVIEPDINPKTSLFFESPVTVSLATRTENAEIRYTLDGAAPNKFSALYTRPIVLETSATLKAQAFKSGMKKSAIGERTFSIVDQKINGLNYSYFEGVWENMPDLFMLSPISQGKVYEFNLDKIERRHDCFAVQFKGFLQIETAGDYIFCTQSNDGSQLFIDGAKVVDNDGLHSVQENSGRIKLATGKHAIEVLYFDGGGSQYLEVMYQGPGFSKQSLPAHRLFLDR